MAVAFVQSASAQGNSGGATTGAKDFTGANFVSLVTDFLNSGGAPTISDSTGVNTWNALTTRTAAVSGAARIYYAINPTVSASMTFSALKTGSFASLAVAGFSGVDTSSPFSAENGATSASASSIAAGSVAGGDVIFTGGLFEQASGTRSIDSLFTKFADLSTNAGVSFGVQAAYKVVTATENPNWSTDGGAAAVEFAIAAFKASSGGGATPWAHRFARMINAGGAHAG